MELSNSYEHLIPDADGFSKDRNLWREKMAQDSALRKSAIDLIVASNKYSYGYQWEWCGVPIIRHPDDIVLQQEIVWELRPRFIIETGVARGGSLTLSSSLMEISGLESQVLGLDIQILNHTLNSLKSWLDTGKIVLFEGDSTSSDAVKTVKKFIGDNSFPVLLVLDSNHSHEHVLSELQALTPLLPKGSIVVVADTIIEEMPENSYPDRPWSLSNNPFTAVQEFLQTNTDFELDNRWSRRSLMGECRDGIVIKR
jgi:cephalosporin hydroxylase